MPKVSVIIPVYNVELYLRECLDSVVKQTLKDIEIICVNDGSTDQSLIILQEYADKDRRIKVLLQENRGQSAARNNGLTIASGKYLYFMDSDDLLSLDTFDILYKTAEENRLDILYFNADVFFENEETRKNNTNYITYYDRKKAYSEVCSGIELLKKMDCNGDYKPSPCLQFINRKYFMNHEINFYEGIIHEDNLFSFKCIVQAERVMHIQNTLFHRRIREGSTMTKTKSARNVMGYFICFVEMLKFCLERDLNQNILQKTITLVFRNAKNIYLSLTESEQKKVVWDTPSFENFLFEMMIRNQGQNQNADMSPERCLALQNQLNFVYQSTSYKIGQKITFVPCKLKSGLQCYRDHGLKYTFNRLFEKIKFFV